LALDVGLQVTPGGGSHFVMPGFGP
jgi:hypothetical protein